MNEVLITIGIAALLGLFLYRFLKAPKKVIPTNKPRETETFQPETEEEKLKEYVKQQKKLIE